MRTILAHALLSLALPAVASAADDDEHLPAMLPITPVTATSTLVEKGRSYAPWQLLSPRYRSSGSGEDMIIDSAWCEAKPDEGIGEAVTITLPSRPRVKSIVVLAGVWKSKALFDGNNKILRLDVSTDDERKFELHLPEKREEAELEIGGRPVMSLTLTIAKVKKGKMNDSCLSAVRVETDPERVVLVGVDEEAVDALEPTLRALSRAFDSCDEKVLANHLVFPLRFASNRWWGASEKKVTNTFKSVTELTSACRAWSKKMASKDEDLETYAARPTPAGIDIDYGRVYVGADGDGAISVGADRKELSQMWRLKWKDRRWRLLAVDY